MSRIECWDRMQGAMVQEKVMDEARLRWLYESSLGPVITDIFFSRKLFSRFHGWLHDRPFSVHKIAPFVRAFGVRREEFEEGPFRSFNHFFARRFKPGARSFVGSPGIMPAFVEGRFLAWRQLGPETAIPVKGQHLKPASLLGREAEARPFENGPVIVARLAPHDYHRFHFLDRGSISLHYRIRGSLHSVNPLALTRKEDILCRNERHVTFQETENFGRVVYVEVGAMTVGRILQSQKNGSVERGQEKGYFEYGGSTVIVLGQPGRWAPDEELLAWTREGTETLVRLGTPVATSTG